MSQIAIDGIVFFTAVLIAVLAPKFRYTALIFVGAYIVLYILTTLTGHYPWL